MAMFVTPSEAGERRNVHWRGITSVDTPGAGSLDSRRAAAIGETAREAITLIKFRLPRAKRAAVAPTIFTTIARAWPV